MTSGPRLTTPVPLQMPQTMPGASLEAATGWAQGHAVHPPPSSRFPYHGLAPGYRKGRGVTTSSQATCGRDPAHASTLSGPHHQQHVSTLTHKILILSYIYTNIYSLLILQFIYSQNTKQILVGVWNYTIELAKYLVPLK